MIYEGYFLCQSLCFKKGFNTFLCIVNPMLPIPMQNGDEAQMGHFKLNSIPKAKETFKRPKLKIKGVNIIKAERRIPFNDKNQSSYRIL